MEWPLQNVISHHAGQAKSGAASRRYLVYWMLAFAGMTDHGWMPASAGMTMSKWWL
jgi:hypothetical protein